MMNRQKTSVQSGLYSDQTFYAAFLSDLNNADSEVITESPFITINRFYSLLPALCRLSRKEVSITVNTRDPIEHDQHYSMQAYRAVAELQAIGVRVLYTARLHRKLAIIDKSILWEGSLNILSFSDSCEIMRRTHEYHTASSTLKFLNVY